MSNDCQCIMDVESPISSTGSNLKRCSSAPMINELNTTMSTATSTTNTASRDSFAFNVFSREQPRTRRFSASFSPLLQSPLLTSPGNGSRGGNSSTGSDSPPDPSSPSPPPSPTPPPPRGLTPRVSQLRQEGRLLVDVAGVRVREAAHERELNSAMQISRSWEDLTLLTPSSSAPSSNSASPPNTNVAAFSPGGHSLHPPATTPPPPHLLTLSPSNVSSPLAVQPRVEGNGRIRGILDPLHVHLPPSCGASSLFSSSSPFSHLSLSSSSSPTSPHPSCSSPLASPSSSFPSPTRPGFSGRQCFSPGSHTMASPSPTRKAYATRRSLSPIAMRPSSLGPVKRKFELGGELGEEKSPISMGPGGCWEQNIYPPAKRANLGLLVTNSNSRIFHSSTGSADLSNGREDSSTGFAFRPVVSNPRSVGEGVSPLSEVEEIGVSSTQESEVKSVPMETGSISGDSSVASLSLGQCMEGKREMMELEKESKCSKEGEAMTEEAIKDS